MPCAVHPERTAVDSIEGRPACRECALQSVLLPFVSVAYLLTLALGYLVFKSRPVVGGLAAMVALFFGRIVQVQLERRSVDAPAREK